MVFFSLSSFAVVITGNFTLDDADDNPSQAAFNFTSNLTGFTGHIVANVTEVNIQSNGAVLLNYGGVKFRNMGGKSRQDFDNINSVILYNFTDDFGQGYSSGSASVSSFPPFIGDAVQFIIPDGADGYYHGLLWVANITGGSNITIVYKLNNQTNNNTFAVLGQCESHITPSSCANDAANNCEWQGTGALCTQRISNFNQESPPAECKMLPRSACQSINDTICTWNSNTGESGQCQEGPSFNQALGYNCTNIINSTFCNNQPFTQKTGLCTFNISGSGQCERNSSKNFMSFPPPPVFFCSAPGYINNRTKCDQLAEQYFMPCGWKNSTGKCDNIFFDFNSFNRFDDIGSQSTCQNVGGNWKTENTYDPLSQKITSENWCEFGVSVKTFDNIGQGGSNSGSSGQLNDCSSDCFACGFQSNGTIWSSSAEFQNSCISSAAGCNARLDSNAFNGYGWCDPVAGFGGFSCDSFCGDCNLKPNASSACQNSPAGCKWDNFTNFCISNNAKGCNQDCFQCSGQTSCQGSPANGGCQWDSQAQFCKPQSGSFEVCFNGIDDDSNGNIDCKDFKCSSDQFCGGSITDSNTCFGNFNAPACQSAGCAWISDTFGFNLCAPIFEQCFRNLTLQTDASLCDGFNDGNTCKFQPQAKCDINKTMEQTCIGYGQNQSTCNQDSRCSFKSFGIGGFCGTKAHTVCFENQTLAESQSACIAAGCAWIGDQPNLPNFGGFIHSCIEPCFNSSINSANSCASANGSSFSKGACEWKQGTCEPKNFIGRCFENDGDIELCKENSNCQWIEDLFGPLEHINGTEDSLLSPQAVWLGVGLNKPTGGKNESNYTLIRVDGTSVTLVMTKENVSITSSQLDNLSRLYCNSTILMQYNFSSRVCNTGTCNSLNSTALCGGSTLNYFFSNYTEQLEVLWQVPIEQLSLDSTEANVIATNLLNQSTVFIDGNLSEQIPENASATDGTNATRARTSPGFCQDALLNNMFSGMEQNPPTIISKDTIDGASDPVEDYLDIEELGVKKTDQSYMYGFAVDSLKHSAMCKDTKLEDGSIGKAKNKTRYFLYLDTDGRTTSGCTPDDDATLTGFEYKFSYTFESDDSNQILETSLSQTCTGGSWLATNIPLKSDKRFSCSTIGGPLFAIDKDSISGKTNVNTSVTWRAYGTSASSSGNSSSVSDKVGPGKADFKGIDFALVDCTSTSDKDNSQCTKFKQFGFYPGEFGPACKDSKDNDGDSLTDCDDFDCKYDPFFCSGSFVASSDDKTAPSLVWTKTNTKTPTELTFIFDTDEPSNGSIKFYNNDSSCATINDTLYDKGQSQGESLLRFRPHHIVEIEGLRANGTYFYKIEVCDPSENCAVSSCSNTTTALTHSNITFKLNLPENWTVDIPSINLTNYSLSYALKASTEFLNNINITIKAPNNSSAITFVGLDIFEKQTINVSEFATGSGFIGMDANQYQSLKQKTGVEEVLVKIPISGSIIEHCDDDGSNCQTVTSEVDCTQASDYTECKIHDAVGLGFSTYKASSSAGGSGGSAGGGGGGGGGGSGGGANTTSQASESTSRFWNTITGSSSTSWAINNPKIPVFEISFDAISEMKDSSMVLDTIEEVPNPIDDPNLKIYQYIKITNTNLPDSSISQILIKFSITKSWLVANSIDAGSITLLRYTDKWDSLSTSKLGEDSEYEKYQSSTPGFSYFAIAGTVKQPEPETQLEQQQIPQQEIAPQSEPSESAVPKPEEPKSNMGYIAIISTIVIVAVVLIYFILRGRKTQKP
ncbi:MAG TPA: PGF-pre-PGF domain-containing protein [Candidatus Nanoarchaeia archaeon]|nr:PGF-pre-PGF domain-containing protein [Candidatus Nanoarchaeia archaeon]